MKIEWYGQSLFGLTTKFQKDEKIRLVIDPFDKKLGLKVPRLRADILLISHDHYDHSNVKAVSGDFFLIDGPGEYEIKGVRVKGIPAFHDDSMGKERGRITIFTIEMEEIKLCFLSDLGQKELTQRQLEEIGEVNILMLPVGGEYTIGAREASGIVNQIEPQIVIPMHYKIPKLKVKLEGVDKFLKVMGMKTPERLSVLSIKKKNLLENGAKVIVLEKQ